MSLRQLHRCAQGQELSAIVSGVLLGDSVVLGDPLVVGVVE